MIAGPLNPPKLNPDPPTPYIKNNDSRYKIKKINNDGLKTCDGN